MISSRKNIKPFSVLLLKQYRLKPAGLTGDVEVIQMNPNKALKKDPIGAQSTFENISSRALGDIQALNATTA